MVRVIEEPLPCKKATCVPCGAFGLAPVKPEPLLAMPVPPVKLYPDACKVLLLAVLQYINVPDERLGASKFPCGKIPEDAAEVIVVCPQLMGMLIIQIIKNSNKQCCMKFFWVFINM